MTGANRSWLFAPGNHPRKVAKVFGAGADAAILDLEDAVATAEKKATRAAVAEALAAPRPGSPPRAQVRVNALETAHGIDAARAICAGGAGGAASGRVEGQFVDYPIVARAERIVALAEAIAGAGEGAGR